MNADWINFLRTSGAHLTEEQSFVFQPHPSNSVNTLYPITQLAAVSVTGEDNLLFLQGQLTCNLNEISKNHCRFAAYCNAKGRVISTLLVCKRQDAFILILPRSLLEKVTQKLRLYILRSKVQLQDVSDQLCLLGLKSSETTLDNISLPTDLCTNNGTETGLIMSKLPGSSNRYLIIDTFDKTKQLWSHTVGSRLITPGDSNEWDYQDLSAGIPWFGISASEEYIPQMLNIDKLGGVSFKKGCYVGQEIVARTHYLGKAKRELVLAECCKTAMIDHDTTIIDHIAQEPVGKIVAAKRNQHSCRLLVVMQHEDRPIKQLMLSNSNQDKIDIIPFQ